MSLLIESAVKVSLIVLAALAGAALMRTRSAALRHWVLAAAVACAAIVPAVRFVAPAWRIAFHGFNRAPSSAVEVSDAFVLPAAPSAPPARSIGAPAVEPGAKPRVATTLAGIWIGGVIVSLLLLLAGLSRLTWIASRSAPVLDGVWNDQLTDVAREYGITR